MTNPTEKTLKPSDSILHRVNATREPNQRTLTLAGGWEPGDTQSVVIAMLRDLDEQHAAQSSPPRLTEKPFFEGLAERQKRRSECPHGVGLCTAGCPSKAEAAKEPPPQPFATNAATLRADCPTPGCWFHVGHTGRCSPDKSEPPAEPSALDAANKEIRRLEEAMAHEIKRHACAELSRHAAWSNSVSAEQARDAALAKVEELQKRLEQAEDDASPGCHLCGRDGDEAPCTEHLCEDCALRWRADLTAATSRAEAAEALLAEIRAVLVSRCWDAGSVKNEQLPGVVVSLLQSQSHLRTVSSAASERAEAAEGRVTELESGEMGKFLAAQNGSKRRVCICVNHKHRPMPGCDECKGTGVVFGERGKDIEAAEPPLATAERPITKTLPVMWFYATSSDSEDWNGPYDSEADAIAEACCDYAGEREQFWVDEAHPVDWEKVLRGCFDADDMLERFAEYAGDNEHIEDPEPEYKVSKEAAQAALEAWAIEHLSMRDYWQCIGKAKKYLVSDPPAPQELDSEGKL